MATYKNITERVKHKHGIYVKSCWIVHVKEMHGLPLRKAPNRINANKRANPCPDGKVPLIEDAFRYYKMI